LRAGARRLEERRGLRRLVLRHEHDAHVVVRLDVIRLGLERLLEVGQRLVVLVLRKVEHGLRDVDVGLGGLRGGARGDAERRNQRDDEQNARQTRPGIPESAHETHLLAASPLTVKKNDVIIRVYSLSARLLTDSWRATTGAPIAPS